MSLWTHTHLVHLGCPSSDASKGALPKAVPETGLPAPADLGGADVRAAGLAIQISGEPLPLSIYVGGYFIFSRLGTEVVIQIPDGADFYAWFNALAQQAKATGDC